MSMGCFKNRVDSERIAGLLKDLGHDLTASADDAEICVINTCAFIKDAVEENIAVILDAVEAKNVGSISKVIVVGCLVNRYGERELAREIPEVDAWIACEDHGALALALGASGEQKGGPRRSALPADAKHVRYLKVSEGCSNHCSYCKIPDIRGGSRSAEITQLVREAEALVDDGAREICLVGQDLTDYGEDRGRGCELIQLLDALESALPHDLWLRLLYLQPKGVSVEILERIAGGRQLLHYMDVPIQHASESVLRAMGRPHDAIHLVRLFTTARNMMPDIALRTTCMVGYPGETNEDFETLLRFLDEVQFDRLGAFIFSPEDGTAAAKLSQRVPGRVKKRRLERLMAHQEDISAARQMRFVGTEMEVVIDSVDGGSIEARSYREAPEVDGVIDVIDTQGTVAVGERLRVKITEAGVHDLLARAVE